jgi:hypothetical protein
MLPKTLYPLSFLFLILLSCHRSPLPKNTENMAHLLVCYGDILSDSCACGRNIAHNMSYKKRFFVDIYKEKQKDSIVEIYGKIDLFEHKQDTVLLIESPVLQYEGEKVKFPKSIKIIARLGNGRFRQKNSIKKGKMFFFYLKNSNLLWFYEPKY